MAMKDDPLSNRIIDSVMESLLSLFFAAFTYGDTEPASIAVSSQWCTMYLEYSSMKMMR
jgi:hypothetical protein